MLIVFGFGLAAEFVVPMLVRPVCRYVRVYLGSATLGAVLARHGWDNPARGPQVAVSLPHNLNMVKHASYRKFKWVLYGRGHVQIKWGHLKTGWG